jgi:hypothetical protein
MRSTLDRLEQEVTALAAVPVSALPVASLQDLVASTARLAHRLTGISSRALAELQVRGNGVVPDPDVTGAVLPTAAWLRGAADVTGTAAGRQIRTSTALRSLPAVVDAIIDGTITPQHGQALSRLVGRIDPAALLRSQPELIEVARRTDPHQLEQYVSHQLATWCEPDLDAEEASAQERRFLQLRDTHRGSVRGSFEIPDAAAEIVRTVLETLARRDGDHDTRTAGQRRADAFTDVFGLALRHADLPDAGGSRPLLSYVIPATWALQQPTPAARALGDDGPTRQDPVAGGAAGQDATIGFTIDLDQHPGADCATAPWTGPATRSRIQTLLCDSRIQRVVLDTGQVISLTSATDGLTAAQRRAIAARDRCCTAKGCTKPPAFCDVHHLRSRADGGRSTIDNLVLLCRRHHVMWHREQLTLTDLRVPWKRLPQPRAPAQE